MLRSFLQAFFGEVVFGIQVKGHTEFCGGVCPRLFGQQSIPALNMIKSQPRPECLTRHQILGFLWKQARRFVKLRQSLLQSLMLVEFYAPLERFLRFFAILLGRNATDSTRHSIPARHGRFWRAIVS
jgi:hypothetical protein